MLMFTLKVVLRRMLPLMLMFTLVLLLTLVFMLMLTHMPTQGQAYPKPTLSLRY